MLNILIVIVFILMLVTSYKVYTKFNYKFFEFYTMFIIVCLLVTFINILKRFGVF